MSAEARPRADGYVTEVGYTYDYYQELNPLHMRLAFLSAGLAVPEIATACELGCGQGVSLVIHAAASQAQWFGTDVNPEHIAFARTLSDTAGANPRLFADSFAEFAGRSDLPQFDLIALHGVWSWISDANRAAVVEFVRRRLKPGGVLYIGYNTLPGWAAVEPIRHLLAEHAKAHGSEGRGILDRVDAAFDFLDRVLATQPGFARDNPVIAEQSKDFRKSSRRYLAHEYFNRDWQPVHFAAMAPWLAPADLGYACSARYFDVFEELGIDAAQRAVIEGVADPGFRETVRDFMLNRRFRLDYWVRGGARRLGAAERDEALRRERIVALRPKVELQAKLRAALELSRSGPGERALAGVSAMLAGRAPVTVGEIERACAGKGVTLQAILEAVRLFLADGGIATAQPDPAAAGAQSRTDRLNAHVLARAAVDNDLRHLASPLTGGGVELGRLQRLFLLARRAGKTQPEEWAQEAGRIMSEPAATPGQITAQARDFARHDLPTLQALQVV